MCHGFRDVANLAWKMAAVVQDNADAAILDTYQPERDAQVRAVIGAAVGGGRYICMLDRQQAAARGADMRARPDFGQSQTAADLIPPIGEGVVVRGSPEPGERFIHPRLLNGRLLDDRTGDGWCLFVRSEAIAGSDPQVTRVDVSALDDGGAVRAWLDSHGIDAALVRPDHFVFGTALETASELLDARRRSIGLHLPTSERESALAKLSDGRTILDAASCDSTSPTSWLPITSHAGKTLKGLIPYEAICKAWLKEPHRFTSDPTHQFPRPNT